ncbi:hypothetical protein NQD34_013378 [Periophthalmus magnuspinnatus]|nr:hypothetical protein NQD34_013378 [Periophthalmus magnuspinnatus]
MIHRDKPAPVSVRCCFSNSLSALWDILTALVTSDAHCFSRCIVGNFEHSTFSPTGHSDTAKNGMTPEYLDTPGGLSSDTPGCKRASLLWCHLLLGIADVTEGDALFRPRKLRMHL